MTSKLSCIGQLKIHNPFVPESMSEGKVGIFTNIKLDRLLDSEHLGSTKNKNVPTSECLRSNFIHLAKLYNKEANEKSDAGG